MRLRIHRGTAEIGGNCIEVEARGKSILLDLGMPLSGNLTPSEIMPPVPGLVDGTNPSLIGIVISHPHSDHYGLVGHAHPSIPVHIGMEAEKLLRASAAFSSFGLQLPNVIHYRPGAHFSVGPFTIIPSLVDHSAFDAYSLLIEADGRRLFYSGDLRGHGWKARSFRALVERGPKGVDAMLLEGTTLSRAGAPKAETEAELMERIADSMASAQGIVLAAFSGQNIDRFVTFYKATQKVRRTFVADLYLAHLLRALERKSLPDPTSSSMRVFLPRVTKLRIVRTKAFDLVEPFRHRRIYPAELTKRSRQLVLSFRSSMIRELETIGCLSGGKVIYSMWPGYIERSNPDLRSWAERNGMEFEIIHTSGHADSNDLRRLVAGISPRKLIPIHTLSPSRFQEFNAQVVRLRDGQWFDV
jgi:ribonuclease J